MKRRTRPPLVLLVLTPLLELCPPACLSRPQTAIRACAIGANVLPGRLATSHFTPSTTLAEHNFLFATPKLFKSGHPERTWHLTVRTWRPTAGLITAGELVDTFQNNFAETAQRMPGFIMYFGCCIEELEEESAFFVNIFETEVRSGTVWALRSPTTVPTRPSKLTTQHGEITHD